MRTFQPAPQTVLLLTDIETFLTTRNPGIRVRVGMLPSDPEQRAFHQSLLNLMPLLEQTQAAIRAYQAALPPPPPVPVVGAPEQGWGVG